MTESTASVLYEVRGAVALVTLNRPQALNSFTREMHHALWAAFDQAEGNPAVRALVLTGAGRGFCAGLDLSELDFTPGPGLLERADPGPVINDALIAELTTALQNEATYWSSKYKPDPPGTANEGKRIAFFFCQ